MFVDIEHSIFFFFNHTIAHPVCDAVIGFFVQVPGQFVIALLGAAALFLGNRYLKFTSLIFLSSFAIARYSYKAIKFFIQRPRPFQALDDVRLVLGEHGGYSFPSGHATVSFCLATVIAMRYPKARYPMFIAATLVAVSRPYVGVHYPSDILVGSLLGMFIGYFVTKTANKIEQ